MRKLVAKYPDGSPINTTFPTSFRELTVLGLVYGIQLTPYKVQGKIWINWGGITTQTNIKRVCDMDFKDWLEYLQKNMPPAAKTAPYDDPKFITFFGWPNVTKYVNNSIK